MGINYGHSAYATIVQALSLLVLCVILVAGLWPFHAPRNDVSWIKNENGLRFGRHGVAVSQSSFRESAAPNDTSCSLEIWLTPALVRIEGATILAFDSSPYPRLPFAVRQYGSGVAIQRYIMDEQGILRRPWLRVDQVFRENERVLLTITSGRGTTSLYVDGGLVGQSSTLGLIRRDLTGRIVVATSTVDDSWRGEVSALAIYPRELTPAEVTNHFESWMRGQNPTTLPAALYRFSERAGNRVHNQMDPATDLVIPQNYFVLHPAFIRPFWDASEDIADVWRSWGYWQDIAINIAGFIPVGFVFMAYCSSVKNFRRAALIVVIMGFTLSFIIEALQRFLPTRDSGMTDLITNTAGTAVGVALYRLSLVQGLVSSTMRAMFGLHCEGQGDIATSTH